MPETADPAAATVAVLGGGSVATSFLHHLVQAGAGPMRVLVFEPRDEPGAGSAYDEDFDSNLLNVTAGSMSVAGDDKLHFMRWLAAEGITALAGTTIRQDSFLPRPLFGRYLRAVFQDTVRAGRQRGIEIVHLPQAAVAVVPDRGSYTVRGADGAAHRAEQVVLAVGNLPATAFRDWQGRAGYFHSPYPTRALADAIDKDAAVCVLGTSLSAVDAVAGLVRGGHRGPITCVSRNGRLPSVRGPQNVPVRLRPAFRAEVAARVARHERMTLDAMAAWLAAELAAHGGRLADLAGFMAPGGDPRAYLEGELALSEAGPRQWQAFGNALNEVADSLWHLLPPGERQRFDAAVRPVWMARRVVFPMENARLLLSLMQAGQLRITGGLRRASLPEDGPGFTIELDGAHPAFCPRSGTRLAADAVVNATSFSADVARSDMPVLRGLVADGLAVTDAFGGLRLDFGLGSPLDAGGRADRSVHVLGSMAVGTYFWTNAMEVNARLAMASAARVAAQGEAGLPRRVRAEAVPAMDTII